MDATTHSKGTISCGIICRTSSGSFKLPTKYRNKLIGGKKKKAPTDYPGQWGRGLGKQGLPNDGTRHVPRKDNRSEALPS
jgi:hypothetical protein